MEKRGILSQDTHKNACALEAHRNFYFLRGIADSARADDVAYIIGLVLL